MQPDGRIIVNKNKVASVTIRCKLERAAVAVAFEGAFGGDEGVV